MSAGLARGGLGSGLSGASTLKHMLTGWGPSSPGHPNPGALRRLLCEARWGEHHSPSEAAVLPVLSGLSHVIRIQHR